MERRTAEVEVVILPEAAGCYSIAVMWQYASRVHLSLGGTVMGDLTNGQCGKKLSSRYYTIVGARSPEKLLPIARQQISYAMYTPSRAATLALAVEGAYADIIAKACITENDTVYIRIDTVPKSIGKSVVALLEASLGMNNDDANAEQNKFQLTHSAKKATFVVSFVVVNNDDSDDDVRYGVSDSTKYVKIASCLNESAAKECNVLRMNHITGEDLDVDDLSGSGSSSPIDSSSSHSVVHAAPVSRAFWKMRQIIDECLADKSWWNDVIAKSTETHGLDLGASPGGWTQALMGVGSQDKQPHVVMSKMLSIDKGIVAKRVLQLNNSSVVHCRKDFTSQEAGQEISKLAPYSSIVCDANIDPPLILGDIMKALVSAASFLLPSEVGELQGDGMSIASLFASNCALVVTLKFPYKSVASVERNLALFEKTLPQELRKIADLDENDPDISYEIVYLYANSASERTLFCNIGGSSKGHKS
jgi:hypothetical protein